MVPLYEVRVRELYQSYVKDVWGILNPGAVDSEFHHYVWLDQ